MWMELSPELRAHLPEGITFDQLMEWPGKEFRHVKNRRTIRFEAGGRGYFMKVHRAAGWAEILKNVSHGRWPTVTAKPEWLAADKLREVGVKTVTVAGRGMRGKNPAARESFIITEELVGMVELHQFVLHMGDLRGMRRVELKRALIHAAATCARLCHNNGINHRDFYLAHLLMEDRDWSRWREADPLELYLIDLHRAQIRKRVPRRWWVKDVSALLFSSLDCGLSDQDLLRFVRSYHAGASAAASFREESTAWRQVVTRAVKLYRKEHGRPPRLPSLLRKVCGAKQVS